jgi:hypothetical protein
MWKQAIIAGIFFIPMFLISMKGKLKRFSTKLSGHN